MTYMFDIYAGTSADDFLNCFGSVEKQGGEMVFFLWQGCVGCVLNKNYFSYKALFKILLEFIPSTLVFSFLLILLFPHFQRVFVKNVKLIPWKIERI